MNFRPALDAIAAALDQPALDHASRSRLLAACGRIGGQPAIQILLRHLSAPADDRRTGVVAALGRCGFQAGPAERPVIELQLDREIEFAGELLSGLEELTGDGPAWALLHLFAARIGGHRHARCMLRPFWRIFLQNCSRPLLIVLVIPNQLWLKQHNWRCGK